MSAAFHSDRWYRVAGLTPVLRPQVRIHRHRYRGEIAYVLQDAASNRMLRLSEASARVFDLMDGRRTIAAIWNLLVAGSTHAPPRQDELIDLLSRAHAFDLIQVDLPPQIATLADRRAKEQRQKVKGQVLNPLSIRLPLWDPERFLAATAAAARPLFGWLGLIIWAAVVGVACLQAAEHWSDLTNNLHDRLLSAANLVALSLIYPLVKALHELGHGYAVKVYGGRVHEMGIMLIYFMPVPYVEASAANAFPDKRQRMVVSAAGILIETFLAAIAMFVWLAVEPGIVRTVAFNVMAICGVSTVLFNGNPLMRYDGYFMLADAVEMPNLAQRSAAFWTRWMQKTLFRMEVQAPPAQGTRERFWLFSYQLASLAYRLFVAVAIAVWLAADFFFIGVLLALSMCWSTALKPLWKGLIFLLTDPRLTARRSKTVLATAGAIAALAAVVAFVPLPLHRAAEGVVWMPDDAQIRAGEDAFVERVLLAPGSVVQGGDAVVLARNSELAARFNRSVARVRELEIEHGMKEFSDRATASVTLEALNAEAFELARLQERQDRLVSRAAVPGRLSIAQSQDLAGRYVHKGELLAYVLDNRPRVARVLVEQDDIDLVRTRLRGARLLIAGNPGERHPTRLLREIPAGQNEIPSPALATAGGGRIVQDPRDAQGVRALNRVFQFDFELPRELDSVPMGTRVYLRLELEPEPAWNHIARRIRQLFLSRLSL
jgi:putative peptide zinc metalloprotease protein